MYARAWLSRCVAVVVPVVLAAGGCASFPGKQLPQRSYSEVASLGKGPAVDYDARFLTQGIENAMAVRIFQEQIEQTFARAEAFETFSAAVGKAPCHLSLTLENRGNMPMAFISGFISGLTFAVLPAYARDNYTLDVDVKRDGKVLKHYHYKDHMTTWIQFFLVVLTPSKHPNKVVRGVFDNMLLNFLYDLHQDKVLKPPPGPS